MRLQCACSAPAVRRRAKILCTGPCAQEYTTFTVEPAFLHIIILSTFPVIIYQIARAQLPHRVREVIGFCASAPVCMQIVAKAKCLCEFKAEATDPDTKCPYVQQECGDPAAAVRHASPLSVCVRAVHPNASSQTGSGLNHAQTTAGTAGAGAEETTPAAAPTG